LATAEQCSHSIKAAPLTSPLSPLNGRWAGGEHEMGISNPNRPRKDSRCGFTSTEQRGRIVSLSLLAMLFLM